jgi:RNA polymerase sigma factor (sigma-70 family)
MHTEPEVTLWLDRLADGDGQAAQRIWDQYYLRLIGLARRKLGEFPRRAMDEEDVVLSAFDSFVRGAAAGRFPQLDDRDDLWRLLVTITARKALAQLRQQLCQKRGGGGVRGESIFGSPDASDEAVGIDRVLGKEPSPQLAAAASEQCSRLLNLLDESLRNVALAKLEGYTNEEIAKQSNCSLATVERKLARIRKRWEGCLEG